MQRYAQFIGNYFNLNAGTGEARHGEAILAIDLEKSILSLRINGWEEASYKLIKITEQPNS